MLAVKLCDPSGASNRINKSDNLSLTENSDFVKPKKTFKQKQIVSKVNNRKDEWESF